MDLSSATLSASLALFRAIELTLIWSRLLKSLVIKLPRDFVGANLCISDYDLLSLILLKLTPCLLESMDMGDFRSSVSAPKSLWVVESDASIFESGDWRGAMRKSERPWY